MPDIPEFTFLRFRDLLVVLGDKTQPLTVMYDGQEINPGDDVNVMDKYVIDLQAVQFDNGRIGLGITLVDSVQTIIMPNLEGFTPNE